MIRHLLLGISILVVASAAAVADDTRAYDTLRSAPRFAVGHVGYVGTISAEEAALHDLLALPTASVDLRRVLSKATLAGQLYALWGLAVAGDADFQKLSERYGSVDTAVETMNGCLVEREAASSIVKKIRRGKYGKPEPRTQTSG